MFDLEKLCKNLSHMIGHELNYDDDKIEVIGYGLFAFIQTILSILLVIIFGMLFNVLSEALIIAFSASILRKYSGGVHASTPAKCSIFGAILSVGMAMLIKNISISFRLVGLAGIIVFIIAYYLIYKLAPVDSVAKPIKKAENIQRLKKSSIFVLTLYLIIVIVNLMAFLRNGEIKILIYSLCIYSGLLWQVFSLTNTGHKFLQRIDALF